jgi:hypothetical protein
MYNILRVWRLTPRMDAPSEHPDDPRGEAPMFVSSPMIMKVLIPHQRANTRDPEIRNPRPLGRGGVIFLKILLRESVSQEYFLQQILISQLDKLYFSQIIIKII